MKKIKVNEDACIGCGACVAIDSEHFDFNDSGLSQVISQDNLDSNEVINAIESCPTSAIIMDNESCECSHDCSCGDDCQCTEEDKCSENCNCDK